MIIHNQHGRLPATWGKIVFQSSPLWGKAMVCQVVLPVAMTAGGNAIRVHRDQMELLSVVVAIGATGIIAEEHTVEAIAHDDTRGIVDA